MLQPLPLKLQIEPLVDAVFEVRFEEPELAVVESVLPGVLYSKLENISILERLPSAEIPKPIRDSDNNLRYIPFVRLDWGEFVISIGDRSITVGCKLPYAGWSKFKPKILEIINLIDDSNIVQFVERYSVKYVNLIQAPDVSHQLDKITVAIEVGGYAIKNDNFSLRYNHQENDILHIITIITGAEGKSNDKILPGVVVDIDSIKFVDRTDFSMFTTNLDKYLEILKQSNKEKFFSCLNDETIRELKPIYESTN